LAFGIVLFVLAFRSAGGGHGSYLPFAIFAAPLSLVPIFGFFAAPLLWASIGWLLAEPQQWLAIIITLSVHTAGVCLVLVLGNPLEPGGEQWRYFWEVERVIPWWLWSAIILYAAGLASAWALAIGSMRANRHTSSTSVNA